MGAAAWNSSHQILSRCLRNFEFHAGCGKCNVTQPALSRDIQQLEEGDRRAAVSQRARSHSFDRSRLLLKPRLQEVFDGLTKTKHDAHHFLSLESADLTLGIMCTIGPCRFTGLLAEFARRYPEITLRLIEGNSRGTFGTH